MHKYIFKRLLMMIPVILGVVFIVFTMNEVSPGNPARIILGEIASEEAVAQLEEEMGLNDPFLLRYLRYVFNAARGDLGQSFTYRTSVTSEVFIRFPTTVLLAGLGVMVALLIGIPLGIISATKQYSIFDNVAIFIGLLGISLPSFWVGLLLIILFTVNLGWLPATGFGTPLHWIMPAITIGTGSTAMVMRMTRSNMLEVIRQDYIRTARAKGAKESTVILKHALRNALIPVVTAVGLTFGFLLGGAVLTETIFSINGLGRFMVDSIRRRDYPIVQGGVLVLAIAFSLINLFVDILYAFIDPRLKSQYK